MQDVNCTFCKIASGELPSVQDWQDGGFVAFWVTNPIRERHLQLIPRAHYPCFDDLPQDLASRYTGAG